MVLLVLAGCSGDGAPGQGPPASSEADLAAFLVAADSADGAEDKVVARCAVCGLAMDGSAEITSTYAGYTFHHCSAHCRELFDRGPVEVLARLEFSPLEGASAD